MKHPFDYQQPTADQVKQIEEIRSVLKHAHSAITETIPHSRERSLALTKLEECSMWANKAIVFQD